MSVPVFPPGLLSFRVRVQDGRMLWNPATVARVRLFEYGDGFALVGEGRGWVARTWWQCGYDEFGENLVDALIDRAFSRWLEN